jgi:copper chaperone
MGRSTVHASTIRHSKEQAMHAFRVDDMTCGHCVSTITKALKAADKDALVSVDLARHLVSVEPAEAGPQALADAIVQAGYTPVPVQTEAVTAKPAKAGGCCGCCGR